MEVIEQATTLNIDDHRQYLQDITQLALDVSVMEGVMDARMEGTAIYMSMVGLESDTFKEAAEDYTSKLSGGGTGNSSSTAQSDNTVYQDADFENNGKILRYVGIGLIFVNVVSVALLTTLARQRRRNFEGRQRYRDDRVAHLVTENGVNKMLETGRRQSEKFVVRTNNALSTAN